jgi:hypothetical protein
MSIQIVSGFQLNTSEPIDSRIVASGSSARDAISYKYHGLRVFDISDNIPYVWNGSNWISENSTGISGNGLQDHVAFFSGANTIDYNTQLFFKKTDTFISISGDQNFIPDTTFHVDGNIKATNILGNGSSLTNLNANNISDGTLALSRLANGTAGWLLSTGSPSPVYINPANITVGTASTATNVSVTSGTNALNYITFVENSTGSNPIKVDTNLVYSASKNIIGSGGFEFNNSATSITGYTVGNTKVITGSVNNAASSYSANTSGFLTIFTLNIPNDCFVTVESTFLTSVNPFNQSNDVYGACTNKVTSFYKFNSSGVGILIGSTSSFSQSSPYSVGMVSYTAYDGVIDVTNNTLTFKSSGTGTSIYSIKSVVYYTVTTSYSLIATE